MFLWSAGPLKQIFSVGSGLHHLLWCKAVQLDLGPTVLAHGVLLRNSS